MKPQSDIPMDQLLKETVQKGISATLDDFFLSRPESVCIYLKAEEYNCQVDFVSYGNNQLKLRIGERSLLRGSSDLYAIKGNVMLHARIHLLSREGECIFTFRLMSPKLNEIRRKSMRVAAGHEGGGMAEAVYISDVVSEDILKECLLRERKRISIVVDTLSDKLKADYDQVRIFLINEKLYDERMKYFNHTRKPLFIADINEEPGDEKGRELLKHYRSIHHQDRTIDDSMISEIAIPFLYKGMIPFGYIQINSRKVLIKEDYVYLKKTGAITSESFSGASVIKTLDERFYVSDLSLNGLCIVFSEKGRIKYFKNDGYLYARLFFPDGRTSSMLCAVRNINLMSNNAFKIGCEIVEIDALGEVNLEEYIKLCVK